MNTWKDMETAPKDRRIIIATDTEMYVANWVKNFVTGDDAWLVARLDGHPNGNDQIIIESALAKAWTEAPPHPFNQPIIDEGKQ